MFDSTRIIGEKQFLAGKVLHEILAKLMQLVTLHAIMC